VAKRGKRGIDEDQVTPGEGETPDSGHLQPVKPGKRLSVASIVIAAVLAVCTIAGVVVLIMIHQALPTWMLVGAVALDVIFAAAVVSMLLLSKPKAHPARFTIATVLAVLLMIGNVVVAKVGTDMLNLGSGIQAPTTDTVQFDVVVLTDGPTDISQLTGSFMGEVQGDPFTDAVQQKIATMVQVQLVPSSPWTGTVNALTAQDVTSIVIQDGFMQILSDADPATFATLRTLTSFDLDSSLAVTPTPTTPPTPTPTPTPIGNSYILYISGIDTSGSVATRSRSDVNILMVVNPDTGKILLVNTPRDYYVQLRGTTGLKDKLTHAGVYGIDVSVGTLEDLYGINIQYYLRLNFSSFVTVIDALGGVDVDSVYNFSADGYTFHVGTNHLSGAAALAFARDRHDFAAGDRVRGENQQRVIEAIIHKLSDPTVLIHYNAILSAIQSSIQTSMPTSTIFAMAQHQLSTGQSWTVTSISVNGSDGSEYTYSYPGQKLYVMIPDQSTVDAAKTQIQATLKGQ